MAICKYEDLGENQMDVFREIGSIGNGNAITALSGLLSEKISMDMPEVDILGFNQAQEKMERQKRLWEQFWQRCQESFPEL